jgi:hypothetical protein
MKVNVDRSFLRELHNRAWNGHMTPQQKSRTKKILGVGAGLGAIGGGYLGTKMVNPNSPPELQETQKRYAPLLIGTAGAMAGITLPAAGIQLKSTIGDIKDILRERRNVKFSKFSALKKKALVNFRLNETQKRVAFLGGYVLPVVAGGLIGTKVGMNSMEQVPDDMSSSLEDRERARKSRAIAGGFVGGNLGVVGGVGASLAGVDVARKAGLFR